jgi:hypothetical protein
VGVGPYENPKVRDAQSPEDLLGQDIGFVYVRRLISGGSSTGYCGPNGVWCPPREDPFYNVRLVEGYDIVRFELNKLSDTSRVVATLPAEVVVEPNDRREVGIMDSIDSPNESVFTLRWANHTIAIKFPLPR